MYTFAIVALMALATLKLVDFLVDFLPETTTGVRSLLTYIVGLGGIWAADYSMFEGFGATFRDHGTSVWMTGFVVVGMTSAWRAVFGYLTHDHATLDETLGEHHSLRKVA